MDEAIRHTTLFPFEKAFRIISTRADSLLKKSFGCGRREMWILLVVNTQGRGQREIGEVLGLHPNVVVKLLDGMEEAGLVRRSRRAEDRREQSIESTAKGHHVLEKYMAEKEELLDQIFSPLSAEQREQWKKMALAILKGVASGVVAVFGHGFFPGMAG
jgi:DNA-binding MarR family transcriptional regulator